jgi:hypothetical protein
MYESINIDIDGFGFKYGYFNYPFYGPGLSINFNEEKVKYALENDIPSLLNAINNFLSKLEELDALFSMHNFELYSLHGRNWESLTTVNDFKSLIKIKKQAELVLNSQHADSKQLHIATTIIDVLNGNYISPPIPEKSPEEKAKAAFEKKRDKLRLKITIERGYKCDQCSKSDEGSLCIIRKDNSMLNYEIENLVLRCRSCINKMKKNK